MGKSSTCRRRLTLTGPSTATACALLEPIAPRGRHSLKSKKGKGFRSGSRGLRLMSNWAYGLRLRPGGFWRRLIAIVLAHAVAVQALLFALGGFSLAVSADQSKPAFELCSHDANGAPQSPASNPDQSGCTHCIFCFAGAHHAVIGTAPTVFHRVNIAMVAVPWLGDPFGLMRPTATRSQVRGAPRSTLDGLSTDRKPHRSLSHPISPRGCTPSAGDARGECGASKRKHHSS